MKNNRVFIVLIVAGMIGFSGMANADLNNGLVAHYPFNGNANDIIGDNHGIVYGATLTADRFGNSNSAYDFDGVDDYIEKNNPSEALNIGSQSWTVFLWVKTRGSDLSQTLVSRYECGWNCANPPSPAVYSLTINANCCVNTYLRGNIQGVPLIDT